MKERTTSNVARRKVGKDFRRLVVPNLLSGDAVKLPDGRIVTYASHSTVYNSRNNASISMTCYPITEQALLGTEPVEIPKTFNCSYLSRVLPINVTVIKRPEIKTRSWLSFY